MADPLSDQRPSLANKATCIFIIRRWHNHHRADPGFAPLVGQQGAHQFCTIYLVHLGPPPTSRDRYRRGIHNVAFNAFTHQHAVQPEPVEARFLNSDDRKLPTHAITCLASQIIQALEQTGHVSCNKSSLRHSGPIPGRQGCDQPSGLTEFQRHENCGKIVANSGRCWGRNACLEHEHDLQRFVWRLHSARASAAVHPTSWDLTRLAVTSERPSANTDRSYLAFARSLNHITGI